MYCCLCVGAISLMLTFTYFIGYGQSTTGEFCLLWCLRCMYNVPKSCPQFLWFFKFIITWVKKQPRLRPLPHAVSQTHICELIQTGRKSYSVLFHDFEQRWPTLVWTLQRKLSGKSWFLKVQPCQIGLWNIVNLWQIYSRSSRFEEGNNCEATSSSVKSQSKKSNNMLLWFNPSTPQ